MALIPYGVTSSTRESARRVVRDAQDEGHSVRRVWGFAPWPDHWNRRCVDFMVVSFEDGQWLSRYLVQYQEPLNLKYLIWAGMQWRNYAKPGIPKNNWRPYWGPNRHYDHCHAEFWR